MLPALLMLVPIFLLMATLTVVTDMSHWVTLLLDRKTNKVGAEIPFWRETMWSSVALIATGQYRRSAPDRSPVLAARSRGWRRETTGVSPKSNCCGRGVVRTPLGS